MQSFIKVYSVSSFSFTMNPVDYRWLRNSWKAFLKAEVNCNRRASPIVLNFSRRKDWSVRWAEECVTLFRDSTPRAVLRNVFPTN